MEDLFVKSNLLLLLFVGLIGLGLGCRKKADTSTKPEGAAPVTVDANLTDQQKSIKGVTDSEMLLQSLSGKMRLLASSFKAEPVDIESFAAAEIDYLGLDELALSELIAGSKNGPLVAVFDWPVSKAHRSVAFAEIWQPILNTQRFEDAQIGVLKGTFSAGPDDFEMETKFEGRMRLEDGRLVGAKGFQTLGWKQLSPNDWKIVSWKQKKLSCVTSDEPLFKNVTNQVIPDAETLKTLSTATHEDLIVERCFDVDRHRIFQDGKLIDTVRMKEAREEFKGCNDCGSVYQFPSASAVDFDLDGFDDLFVTDRWQAPQLLRNMGDGTFTDVTLESGIDIPEMATCGYFFDYDNDGDPDLLVGCSMVASKFYVNEGGVFKAHEAINQVLEETRFVIAISIADINHDGLLDLYLSTYATGTGPISDWIDHITREKDRLKTKLKLERSDKYVDRGGPPNILLMNRGETFQWVRITDELQQFRNSYQSSWMDYDQDGDFDLYICNDFASDVFLRNDTEQGSFEPKFVDVTDEIVPRMVLGYGMGCSWGDFDNDSDLDLYVSNMYSKAGNRIVDQMLDADPRLKVAVHGNFLFENIGKKFKQIGGAGDGQQHVSTVGWSYGGQFADFDNDGELDIYVPSGCYSAPQEVQTTVDL